MPEDYYQLGCFVIGILMFFFVCSAFSVLRWRFLFSTSTDEAPIEENKNKCIISGELKKTFKNKRFPLSKNATCKKKKMDRGYMENKGYKKDLLPQERERETTHLQR